MRNPLLPFITTKTQQAIMQPGLMSQIKNVCLFRINFGGKIVNMLLVLIWMIASSCGGGKTESSSSKDTLNGSNTIAAVSTPVSSPGQALIAKANCSGCHQPSTKVVGPSYSEVAKKYAYTPENISKLASNIINGVGQGKGVWGQLPMAAHPQLSKADAEEMVKYILSVK